MGDKNQMDDFASLFLPDLLNPLDALVDDDRKLGPRSRDLLPQHQHQHQSPGPTRSSSGMSLIRFFEPSQPVSTQDPDSGGIPSTFSDVNQYLSSPQPPPKVHSLCSTPSVGMGVPSGQASNFGPNVRNEAKLLGGSGQTARPGAAVNTNLASLVTTSANSASHCASPYSALDIGHTSHYADFLHPEASYQPPVRQRQYHMGQQQYSAGSHAFFDTGTWTAQNDLSAVNRNWYQQTMYGQGFMPNADTSLGSDYSQSGAWQNTLPQDTESVPEQSASQPHPDLNRPKMEKLKSHKTARPDTKPVRSKQPVSCSSSPAISVDYSTAALDQLVDLKPPNPEDQVAITSSTGVPLKFKLRGFLHGRLLSNDQDNYNYINLSTGGVDPTRTYMPQVISCYRRNFINLHLHFEADNPTLAADMMVDGSHISKLRVDINAITDKTDPKPVALLDNENDAEMREGPRRVSDSVLVEMIGSGHVILPPDIKKESFWKVKKLQFKSATANSTNLSFQTYYRFLVRVFAETPMGDVVVDELVSNPIIVRGRNPSFYHSKNDVLIKAKSPNAASNYQYTNNAVPLLSDEFSGVVPEAPDLTVDLPVSAHMAQNHSQALFVKQEPASAQSSSKPEYSSAERTVDGSDQDSENVQRQAELSHEQKNPGQGIMGDRDDMANRQEAVQVKREDTAEPQLPNLPSTANDIRKIIDAMPDKSGKGERYHYFPISSVYYLPPINVVYFPHAAHHTESATDEGTANEGKPAPVAAAPSMAAGSDKKPSSKVYFR